MSVDETAHANLVRYQRRLVTQNMKLFGDVTVDIEAIKKVISHIESVLSGPPPSVSDAVRIAIDIENSAAETHYLAAIRESASGITGLLNSLESLDCSHCGVFEEFARHRSYPFVSDIPKTFTKIPASTREMPSPADNTDSVPPELLDRINNYYIHYEFMDYYELLGVKDYAGSDAIKHAFHERAKEFHPDRLMNVSNELKQKLNAVFGKMTLAYSTLMSPVRRKEYEKIRTSRSRH